MPRSERISFFGVTYDITENAPFVPTVMKFVRDAKEGAEPVPSVPLHGRNLAILATVALSFAVFVIGIMKFGWDFDQLSAPFVAMGIVAGLVGGLGVAGTSLAFAEGFASMASAAMLSPLSWTRAT